MFDGNIHTANTRIRPLDGPCYFLCLEFAKNIVQTAQTKFGLFLYISGCRELVTRAINWSKQELHVFLLSQRMTASQWEIIWLRRMREYKIILSPKELTREHTENAVASSLQQQLVCMSPPTLVSPVTYCLYSSSPQTCLSVSSHVYSRIYAVFKLNCLQLRFSLLLTAWSVSFSVYSLPLQCFQLREATQWLLNIVYIICCKR